MTNIAQFLLVIVITTLTFLAAIISIQIVHLLHDLRKAVQKFSRLLDNSGSVSDLIKSSDTGEPLELDESQPVWLRDEYANADVSGSLVYFPQEFSKNHQGKTKREILKEQGGFPASRSFGAGWNVLLLEDLPNIPRAGKGKELKGRKQLEAGGSAQDFLKALQTNPQYKNESGMTPEDQIVYAILHLEQTNQVIDDWQDKGSISYQLGSYFPVSDDVPYAYWGRWGRQACLDRYDPANSSSIIGARGTVRI